MDRRWGVLAVFCALMGPAWAQPAGPGAAESGAAGSGDRLFNLTCWQNGLRLFSESELTGLTVTDTTINAWTRHGQRMQLIGFPAAAPQSVCLISTAEAGP